MHKTLIVRLPKILSFKHAKFKTININNLNQYSFIKKLFLDASLEAA